MMHSNERSREAESTPDDATDEHVVHGRDIDKTAACSYETFRDLALIRPAWP